jgi:ribosomal-protein-alanine N-acetyltransferase
MTAPMSHSVTSSPDVTLRAAVPGDVQRLADIELLAFADPWPVSAFRDMLQSPRARTTVAVDSGGVPVGYCILLLVAEEGEIANLAVVPAARRHGIAAALLDHTLRTAAAAHAQEVFLEVRASNAAAQSLYASRGFATVGRRRGYYQQPVEDALLLRWRPASLDRQP